MPTLPVTPPRGLFDDLIPVTPPAAYPPSAPTAASPGLFDHLIPQQHAAGLFDDLIPSPPPGFVVDSPTTVPQPPPGFVLDGADPARAAQQAIDSYDDSTTMLQRAGRDLSRGALRAAQTAASLFTGESALMEANVAAQAAGREPLPMPSDAEFSAAQAGRVAGLQRDIDSIPRRPVTEQIGAAQSWRDVLDALTRDPVGAVAGFGLESLPAQAPALAAGALTGGAALAPAIGASSYVQERQSGILEFLAQQGVDIRDPRALTAAIANDALMQQAREYGQTRGAIIAPVDALTAGLAGRVLAPSGVTSKLAREIINVPAQVAAQGAAGGGAEAAAQLATTGKVGSPGEVAAEAIGEAFSAPADIASAGARGATERAQRQAQATQQSVPSPAMPVNDSSIAASAEGTPVPATQPAASPMQPAEALAPPTSLAVTPPPVEAAAPATPPQSAPEPAAPAPSVEQAPSPSERSQRVQGARGTSIDTEYQVVELDSLKPADAEFQPRNRVTDPAGYAAQQQRQFEAFNPGFLGRGAQADTGAPIVGPDDKIDSGNGRRQLLDRVYREAPEKATAYRQMIEAAGFPTAGLRQPVLIRRRTTAMTAEQRASWASEANETVMQALDADERARMDAREITPELLTRYNPDAEITSATNRGFVSEFVRRAGADPRAFFGSDGAMTQDGTTRMRRAMLSAAFGGTPAADRIVADIVSNVDPEVGRQLAETLTAFAPQFAELKGRIQEGHARPEASSLGESLATAVQWINQQRQLGENPVERMSQGDLLGQAVTAETEAFVRLLVKPDGRSIQTKAFLRDFFRFLMEEVRAAPSPTNEEAIRDAGDRAAGRFTGTQQGTLLEQPESSGDRERGAASGPQARRPGGDAPGASHAERTRSEREPGADDEAVAQRASAPSGRSRGPFAAKREGLIGTSTREDVFRDAARDPGDVRLLPIDEQARIAIEQTKSRFGFQHIEIDRDLPTREAVDALMDGYVSLRNMAAVLGVSPQVMSLNGKLRLQFHRSAGNALAYFKIEGGDRWTIGMVRRNDSFAHEWGHALDYFLMEQVPFRLRRESAKGQGATGKVRAVGTELNDRLSQAFVSLLNAMYFDAGKAAQLEADLATKIRHTRSSSARKRLQARLDSLRAGSARPGDAASDYYSRAKAADGKGAASEEGAADKGYWQKPTEMLARAFEAWIAARVEQAGALDTNFIAARDYMYRGEAFQEFSTQYPRAADRVAIFNAIEEVVAALHAQTILGPHMAENIPTVVQAQPDYWKSALPDVPKSAWRRAQARAKAIQHENDHHKAAAGHRGDARRAVRQAMGSGDHSWLMDSMLRIQMAAQDMKAGWFTQVAVHLQQMTDRYPQSRNVRQLVDWFATDPGTGKFSPGKFDERWKPESRRFTSRLAEIVERLGVNGWDDAKLRALRDQLVNAEQSTDPEVRRAAVQIRLLADDLYNHGTRAGLKLGYAKGGYLPRMVDEFAVAERGPDFQKKATTAYELVFDREWPIEKARDPSSDTHASLLDIAKQLRGPRQAPSEPAIHAALEGVKAATKRLGEAQARLDAARKARSETEALKDQAKQAADALAGAVDALHAAVKPVWAALAAADYHAAILGLKGSGPIFETRSPAGSFLKGRTLPPEADRILGDYYITDPVLLMSTYISQLTRRAAFAEFFGTEERGKAVGWKLEEALDGLTAAGVLDDDAAEIRRAIDVATGRGHTTMTPRGMRWKSRLTSFYAPVLLAGAALPNLLEVVTVARQSGRVRDALAGIGSMVQELAVNLTSHMPKSWAERVRYWDEFSEHLGITSNALTDEIVNSRANLLYQTPKQQARLARAMSMNLTHPITMATRRALAQIAVETFNREFEALQNPESDARRIERATRFLGEYGITASDEQVASLMARLRKAPSAQSIESDPAFQRLQLAVLRFVNQANQDPSAIDKPRAASMPEYAHLYGLMSFLAAFHRNFVLPTATLLARAAKERDGQLLYMALAPIMLITAAQLAARCAQFLLTGRGDDDELKRELTREGPFGLPNWLWWSVSSSSMLGMYDPLLQAFVSVRYNKPISNLMLGPTLTMPANLVQAGINLASDRNSPNTTTAEFRAAQATYDALIGPLLMQALLRSPYAPFAPQPIPFLAGMWLSKSGVGPIEGPRTLIPDAMGLEQAKQR